MLSAPFGKPFTEDWRGRPAAVFEPSGQYTNKIFKEQVTVVDNAASDVRITIKPKQ